MMQYARILTIRTSKLGPESQLFLMSTKISCDHIQKSSETLIALTKVSNLTNKKKQSRGVEKHSACFFLFK